MNYEKIKSWEAACKVHGRDPKVLPQVDQLPEKFKKWLIATYKLGVITEAINTDENGKVWEPDYSNWDQYKYFPAPEVDATEENPGGVGFSHSGYVNWAAISCAGSRFCFDTSEKAMHIQKHFEEELLDFHLIR